MKSSSAEIGGNRKSDIRREAHSWVGGNKKLCVQHNNNNNIPRVIVFYKFNGTYKTTLLLF